MLNLLSTRCNNYVVKLCYSSIHITPVCLVGTSFPRTTEFASFRRISLFLRNFAELGNFRAHSVDLCYHLIDLLIIPIDKSSICTKIDRLLHSLSTVLTYGTICSCAKCILHSQWILHARTFVYIMDYWLFTCGINHIISKLSKLFTASHAMSPWPRPE